MMTLEVKGFTTKGELKQAARERAAADIFLDPVPSDGTYKATPLGGRWEAWVTVRSGRIVRVR